MALEAICDGCSKRERMVSNGRATKPHDWFARITNDGDELIACSRNCIKRIHDKRQAEGLESHTVVLPI